MFKVMFEIILFLVEYLQQFDSTWYEQFDLPTYLIMLRYIRCFYIIPTILYFIL